MDDFIELDNVYLTGKKPYDVKGEGAQAGKTYKGFTYTFILKGNKRKISSDLVDLPFSDGEDMVKGTIKLGVRDKAEANDHFMVKLLGFKRD